MYILAVHAKIEKKLSKQFLKKFPTSEKSAKFDLSYLWKWPYFYMQYIGTFLWKLHVKSLSCSVCSNGTMGGTSLVIRQIKKSNWFISINVFKETPSYYVVKLTVNFSFFNILLSRQPLPADKKPAKPWKHIRAIPTYKGGFRGGGQGVGPSPLFQSGPPIFVETWMPIQF